MSYQVVLLIVVSVLKATFLFSFSQFLLQCLIHIIVSGKLMQAKTMQATVTGSVTNKSYQQWQIIVNRK